MTLYHASLSRHLACWYGEICFIPLDSYLYGLIDWLGGETDRETGKSRHTVGNLYVWNVLTGQLLHTVSGLPIPLSAATISPDGQLFASGYENGVVKLWNLPVLQLLYVFAADKFPIKALTFSANGRHLIGVNGPPDGLAGPHGFAGAYGVTGEYNKTIKIWEIGEVL